MALNFDEMRKAVAMRHDVLIGEDDPLLIEATMLENLLEQCVKTLNAALQRGEAEAKKTAARIITDATGYVSDQVHTAVTAAMDEGRDEIRKDLRLAWNKMEESRKAAATWAAASGLCAAIAVVAIFNVF